MVSDFYTKECQLPVFDREETILLRRTKSHDQGENYERLLQNTGDFGKCIRGSHSHGV